MEPHDRKEFFACLALNRTPGLGARRWKPLIDAYGSAYAAHEAAAGWGELATDAIVRAHLAEEWREAAEAEYRAVLDARWGVVCYVDEAYPARLRQIADPPTHLYCLGDLSLLAAPSVAVVGARDCSRTGLAGAARLAGQLSRCGVTVVSGLALGIDRQAHKSALGHIGSTVAVLGCGLDVGYPPLNQDLFEEIAERGLVVSEFAPGAPPEARNFPFRNRIIAGMSLGVVVAEAAGKSGSLITAKLALEQGKDVFALPGPSGGNRFAGSNQLIKSGAPLVETAEDVLSALHLEFSAELPEDILHRAAEAADESPASAAGTAARPSSRAPSAPPEPSPEDMAQPLPEDMAPAERLVMEQLLALGQAGMDALCQAAGLGVAEVSEALVLLEMRGLVRKLPGMRYTAS